MSFGSQQIFDAISLTEAAALACYEWIGKGQEKLADQAAVAAMRAQFERLDLAGKVVIGEGERDEAPMLYIGEEVGKQDSIHKVDIAVDPLEGTTLCAHAAPNSISVLALAPRGSLLHAPDVYMEKIAVGKNLPKDLVDLDASVEDNLKALANAKKCAVTDLKVCILNRPRHEALIAKVRAAGARVQLITDGDVTACIATVLEGCDIDIYLGVGGAPEGVLAAAALKSMGGFFQGRLQFKDDMQKNRAITLGITNPDAKLSITDMVRDDVIFAASGVTSGWFLPGVKKNIGQTKVYSFATHFASSKQIFVNNIMSA